MYVCMCGVQDFELWFYKFMGLGFGLVVGWGLGSSCGSGFLGPGVHIRVFVIFNQRMRLTSLNN